MTEGPSVTWHDIADASHQGRLMEVLAKLGRERWAEKDRDGHTLLHYACLGANEAAVVELLASNVVDVNERTKWQVSAAHKAVTNCQRRVLELLCAAGADLRGCDRTFAPLDVALSFHSDECVRILLSNGVRLSTVHNECRQFVAPKFAAFERRVLRCRSAAVALLRVKKIANLWRWDKFLLKEVAIAVWATRYGEEWQN